MRRSPHAWLLRAVIIVALSAGGAPAVADVSAGAAVDEGNARNLDEIELEVGTAPGAPRASKKAARSSEEPARTEYDLRTLTASPVPGVESSGFGWREDPFHRRRKFHKGTDYRADRGTSVFAAGAGTVTIAGRKGGYGKVVFLDHGDGVITRYGHLRAIDVEEGAVVAAGAKIGEVGSTGRATGPHLHFEVRLDGRAVNPKVAMALAQLQRADPAGARAVAATLLSPEAQEQSQDPKSPRRKSTRPERKGRAKRAQVLW